MDLSGLRQHCLGQPQLAELWRQLVVAATNYNVPRLERALQLGRDETPTTGADRVAELKLDFSRATDTLRTAYLQTGATESFPPEISSDEIVRLEA